MYAIRDVSIYRWCSSITIMFYENPDVVRGYIKLLEYWKSMDEREA